MILVAIKHCGLALFVRLKNQISKTVDTNAREHNSNFGDPEARMDTFMKHYDEVPSRRVRD